MFNYPCTNTVSPGTKKLPEIRQDFYTFVYRALKVSRSFSRTHHLDHLRDDVESEPGARIYLIDIVPNYIESIENRNCEFKTSRSAKNKDVGVCALHSAVYTRILFPSCGSGDYENKQSWPWLELDISRNFLPSKVYGKANSAQLNLISIFAIY